MTNKQLKQKALEILTKSPETPIVAMLYMITFMALIVIIESLIYIVLTMLGFEYHVFVSSFYEANYAKLFLVFRLTLYYASFSTLSNLNRRTFINVTDSSETGRFITKHKRKVIFPIVKKSFALLGLKLLVLLPISVGIYGVVYFAQLSLRGEITLFGMVLFMLSLGFSIVWLGECVHYYMSLSLVKYIIVLNPRVNFFDACDLSVKLMENQHLRLMSFYFSLLPIFLLLIFAYPLLLIYPYFSECKVLLAKELMGNHWQDKLPAMSRRWEKQQSRLENKAVQALTSF
ncbi:MAG: hypothetical protein LUE12_08680 [Ruminococcus sp.]|nr:hypothetical protein [Ruminococcus sp.]